MEGEGPSAKRAKRDDKTPAEASNKPKSVSTSSPVDKNVDLKRKVPKAKPKPIQFAELNEECLLEIIQRMKLGDICSMAEVCVRFKVIARKFFTVKHGKVSLSLLADTPDGQFSLLKVRQLLYNFGNLISTLTIDLDQLDDPVDCAKLLSLVGKYCLSTIESLEFPNQPNDRLGEFLVSSVLGLQLMIRDAAPGNFNMRNKLVYQPGKSTQIQTLERIE